MNILYCCPFNTDLPTGKNRATRHKINALKEIADNVFVIIPRGKGKILRSVAGLMCEVRCVAMLFKHGRDIDFYVSRGNVGMLSVPLARMLRVRVLREVHADPFGELALLDKSKLVKGLLRISFYCSLWVNRIADVRIFNNPLLKEYFINKGWGADSDVVSYNGGSADAVSETGNDICIKKYGLLENIRYLAFVGSASKWHGVSLLVALQEEFNTHGDNVKILCAGGKVSDETDPERFLINITPLDDIGCAEIIQCSSACLLPVENNRVSPGSPLKLYDYMVNGKAVIAQQNLPGYSDEVELYNSGVTVDFHDAASAREKIIDFLDKDKAIHLCSENAKNALPRYCWSKRVKGWFENASPLHD